MTEQYGSDTFQQLREELLGRSSLLCAFLADEADRAMWIDGMRPHLDVVEHKLQGTVPDWQNTSLATLRIFERLHEIFDPEMQEADRTFFTTAFLAIGYDLGTLYVGHFLNDLFEKASEKRLLNFDTTRKDSLTMIASFLLTGVYFNQHYEQGIVSDVNDGLRL